MSLPRVLRRAGFLAVLSLTAILPAFLPAAYAGPDKTKAAQVRSEAFRLLNEGVAAYGRGEFARAAASLRRSAEIALNSFQAHYYLGLALIGDRRYDDAVAALKVALDLEPKHLQAHIAMGDAHLRRGDVDEAQAEYTLTLKLRADFPSALDGIARAYEARGQDEKAIEHFEKAMASNKGFVEAYTHLGDLYLRRDRLDEAARILLEAASIHPNHAPTLNRLALAYDRLGLDNEAVAAVRKAILLEPAIAEHRATLGTIQLGLDLLDNAESSFKEAIAIDAGLPSARMGLSEVARRRGDYASALSHLDALLADERTDPRTREEAEKRKGALEAERVHLLALEGRVASGDAAPEERRTLAEVYAGRGMWIRAAETLGSPPSDADRERRGYYLLRGGRYRDAHSVYAGLARETPRAPLEINAGVALARLGDDAGAVEAYRRGLAIEPARVEAQVYLGNALIRLGRKDEAVAVYRAALSASPSGLLAERVRRLVKRLAPQQAVPEPARAGGAS